MGELPPPPAPFDAGAIAALDPHDGPPPAPARRCVLTYDPGPRWSSTNRKLAQHWAVRSEETAAIRTWAWGRANEAGRRLPRMDAAHVIVRHVYARGVLPDTDAPALAVKALLDGLVDAGVLPTDTGEHVLSITYMAAELGEANALTLELVPTTPGLGTITAVRSLDHWLQRLADWWLGVVA